VATFAAAPLSEVVAASASLNGVTATIVLCESPHNPGHVRIVLSATPLPNGVNETVHTTFVKSPGEPPEAHLLTATSSTPTTVCIEWGGKVQANNGYGRTWRHGKRMYAHRAAWEDAHGPIPVGLYVCHRCDNRRCVNPEHLFIGTAADNGRDASIKGRYPRGERQHRSKLTEDQVREIRRLYSEGVTQAALVRMFGVNQGTIWPLLNGKTWQHVD
jgi:hypothetical protein